MPNSAWKIINLTTSKPPDKVPHTSDNESVLSATVSRTMGIIVSEQLRTQGIVNAAGEFS